MAHVWLERNVVVRSPIYAATPDIPLRSNCSSSRPHATAGRIAGMDDDVAFACLWTVGAGCVAAILWLLIVGLQNRPAKPAVVAAIAMLVIALLTLLVTLPNWAC